MKARKLVSAILCLALMISMVACSGGTSAGDSSDNAGTDTASSDEATQTEDEEIVIALMMKSLASEWNQNIESSLETLGEEKGFKVLTFDADGDSATQLDQLNDAINQGVDAIFMHIADEGIAQAAAEIAADAGIPMIGESLPLKDEDGNWLIPCVVLDAAGCGTVASDWVAENWESTEVDLSDTSKVGVIFVTNTLTENAVLRHEGAMTELKAKMPEIPEENYYIADISASSDDYIDGGYTETGAVLAAHPDMTSWIIIGVQDDYALGACRAIEEAGAADTSILVSLGGEQAIPEWEGGTTKPWYATVYYTAMDFTEPVVDGLLSVVNNEATLEEVYSDNIAEGQTYGTKTISGTAITYENYKEYVE
ncbi:MAG: substrate-binding domain-containing protein [Lachnospiraceae bacterium]